MEYDTKKFSYTAVTLCKKYIDIFWRCGLIFVLNERGETENRFWKCYFVFVFDFFHFTIDISSVRYIFEKSSSEHKKRFVLNVLHVFFGKLFIHFKQAVLTFVFSVIAIINLIYTVSSRYMWSFISCFWLC